MKSSLLLVLFSLCPVITTAATLRVGPGEAYGSIQAAIDAAVPGDTIEVKPGLYQENLVVAKAPLVLSGARAADDARGRVSGAPDPAVESVVAPTDGKALELASADGPISVSGFSFVASVAAGSGVISADTADLTNLLLANNHVQVAAGATGAAVWLNRNAVDATMTGNVFAAAAGSTRTVALAGENLFHGLRFADNHVLRTGTAAGHGFSVEGNRNLGPSALRAPAIQGNRFQGHAVGFHGGARALNRTEFSGNIFTGNIGGMAAGPLDAHLSDNEWSGNSEYGLRLTAFGNVADPTCGARDNLIEGNRFLTNGTAASPSGYGDFVCDQQAGGTQDTNALRRNSFASTVAAYANDAAATIDAAWNYWGAADGPGGNAPGSGGAILGPGSVTFEPYYADAAMSVLVYGSAPLAGEVVLSAGQSITGPTLTLAPAAVLRINEGARLAVDDLSLPADSSVIIRRGEAVVGKVDMRPGAVLDVIDGQLSLDPAGDGQYHTINGSFTFFNCFGSLQINGNTTFSGDTFGLSSDLHVLPGSTMLVLGSLVLDGCRIDSTGTYSLLVNIGATLTMTRCDVTGAAISLVGSNVTLRDNRLTSTSVTAFYTVNGAKIYHNVFTSGLGMLNVLPGAVVTTTAEGWGNVTSPAAVQNELSLGFRPPADVTRTLDTGGNLYVQPGDLLDVGLDIGRLNAKMQAVEALLGFSTDYLTFDSLLPSAVWSNELYGISEESDVVGKFNTAVGLGFLATGSGRYCGRRPSGEHADAGQAARRPDAGVFPHQGCRRSPADRHPPDREFRRRALFQGSPVHAQHGRLDDRRHTSGIRNRRHRGTSPECRAGECVRVRCLHPPWHRYGCLRRDGRACRHR